MVEIDGRPYHDVVRSIHVRYEVDFGWKATELGIITLRIPPSPKRD
jgi:hypothetical protein